MAPEYTTATGPAGALAELMGDLSRQIWGCDWVGGLEHQLWSLYLDMLARGVRPGPNGARVLAFGALVSSLDGLWAWPFDEPGPRWSSLAEHARLHEAWRARAAQAAQGEMEG